MEFKLIPELLGAAAAKPPDCEVCPEMVNITGGKFTMGSEAKEADKDEAPLRRELQVRPFLMGKYEVSVAEFRTFVKETRRTIADGKWERPFVEWGYEQGPDEPVVYVSYDNVQAYITWLNGKHQGKPYRLPSEAEWEYAARGGTTTERYWGDDANLACAYANVSDRILKSKFPATPESELHQCDDGYIFTAPKNAGYKSNRFGLQHMLGNVAEWVEDCYHDSYRGAPSAATAWNDGAVCASCNRVVRGGSWFDDPGRLRSADRDLYPSGYCTTGLGFRLVQDLP